MTEKASFVITDSADTPESPGTPAAANRTFTPGEMENGSVHCFYNTTTGTTPATRSKFTASLTSGQVVHRVKFSLALPKAQTVDGVVKVAHVSRAIVEFILPIDCSRDDRRDLLTLMYDALSTSGFNTMVIDVEDLW